MTAVLSSCLLEQHNVLQSLPVPLSKVYQENVFLLTCVLSCHIPREEVLLRSVSWTQTGCSKADELGSLRPTNASLPLVISKTVQPSIIVLCFSTGGG